MSELKLTNNQFKTVLESKIQNNELGLKDIIQFSLNILMKSERTLFLNKVSDASLKAWEANIKVHKRGLELIKPGARCSEICKEFQIFI